MRTVALGDLMVERAGTLNPAEFPDEEFELYSIPAHDRGGPEIARGSVIGSVKQLVQPGDVLISKIIPHIRRARVVGTVRGRRQIASGEWIVFRGDLFDPGYLRHLLVSDRFHAQYMNTVAGLGGSLVRARPQQVKSIPIPFPPVDEQRRIAAILDQADALRAKRRQVLAYLDTLTLSIFNDMFGVPIVPGVHPRRPLGAVARIIRGASPRPAGDPRYFGGSIPWLKISDITSEPGPVVRRIKESVTEEGRRRSVLLPPNTLVLTNSATVGIPKIIEPATCIHDGFLAFIDLDPGVDRLWLWSALVASRPMIVALAPEGTQKNLNTPIVKAVELTIPPPEQQLAFKERHLRIAAARVRIAHAVAWADELFASLQSHAFRGGVDGDSRPSQHARFSGRTTTEVDSTF